MTQTVKIYVQLLDEGTDTMRPTQAIKLGEDIYEVMPTPDYDPEDKVWEFLPGTAVRCQKFSEGKEEYLLAVDEYRENT